MLYPIVHVEVHGRGPLCRYRSGDRVQGGSRQIHTDKSMDNSKINTIIQNSLLAIDHDYGSIDHIHLSVHDPEYNIFRTNVLILQSDTHIHGESRCMNGTTDIDVDQLHQPLVLSRRIQAVVRLDPCLYM